MDVTTTSGKTRALRKYEAAPAPFKTEPGFPPLDLFSPFGPLIARGTTPQILIDKINHHADSVVRRDTGSEFLLPHSLAFDGGARSLAGYTEGLIRRYVELIDEPAPARVRIDVFWIVSQYAGTPSPVHFHSCDISGVLYLKMPELEREDQEIQKTYISGRQAGYINLILGGKQRFAKSLVSFKPVVGDFYIFPGWLLHGVEPFRGRGERRSLAFNAYVDDSSVYSPKCSVAELG